MTTIAAQLAGGIWGPVTPIPSGAIEVVASPNGYTVVTENDFYSATPPVTPYGAVTNVFAGTKNVPASAFGVVYQKYPAVAPSAGVADYNLVRFHDYSGGSSSWLWDWARTEPTQGVHNWTLLDAAVDAHVAAGRTMLYQLLNTPTWASVRPTEASPYNILGASAEPSNMQYWTDYCTAVATRYAGKIGYYSVWNEANIAGFFSGTQAVLSQMTRLASQAIKAADPAAKILSPSVTSLNSGGNGLAYFLSMMQASDGAVGTMKDWIDIVEIHLYPNTSKPQEIASMIAGVRAHMATLGISAKPLWNTEFSYINPDFSTYPADKRKTIIQRLMTLSLANNAGGCDVSTWYGVDASSSFGFTADDVAAWNAFRLQLMGGITVVNNIKDGRTAAVIGGQQYLWGAA